MTLYEIHRMTQCKSVKKAKIVKEDSVKKLSECPICFQRFKRKLPLFAHMKSEHKDEVAVNPQADKYMCKLCNKKLRTRAGFNYHMRRHYGYPRYACTLCSKRFTAASALRNHVAGQHAKLRPHLCQQCGNCFVSADHLRKHLALTHGGRRDFLCNVCGARFQQSSHVRQHQWVHTGVKPCACAYCAARYSSRGSLKKHYLKMHNEEYSRDLEQREKEYAKMEQRDRERDMLGLDSKSEGDSQANEDAGQELQANTLNTQQAVSDQNMYIVSFDNNQELTTESSVSIVVEVNSQEDFAIDNIANTVQILDENLQPIDDNLQNIDIDYKVDESIEVNDKIGLQRNYQSADDHHDANDKVEVDDDNSQNGRKSIYSENDENIGVEFLGIDANWHRKHENEKSMKPNENILGIDEVNETIDKDLLEDHERNKTVDDQLLQIDENVKFADNMKLISVADLSDRRILQLEDLRMEANLLDTEEKNVRLESLLDDEFE